MESGDKVLRVGTADVEWEARNGSPTTRIGWATRRRAGDKLASGFGRISSGQTASKTLDYDEIIHVLSGELSVLVNDDAIIGRAGDVISIRRGTTLRYSGVDAEFFFVVTND